MECPVCDEELKMAERKDVEIDYCPKCRGVWLDRGELDKIIGRSSSGGREKDEDEYSKKKYDDDDKHYKKKSMLKDIFDF